MATGGVGRLSLAGEETLRWASPRVLLAVAAAVAWWCAVRAQEWAWWRPRRLGRALRSQGLRGTAYRPVAGDEPLNARLNREARSRDLPLGCHDVVPRTMPLLHRLIGENGKTFITWFGPVPRVTITKPELVREVLSNKFGHFEKFMFSHFIKLLHDGVSSREGEQWAKHPRIINPAFHLEKLKRMLPAFAACCTDLVDGWEGLAPRDDEPIQVDVWSEMQKLTGDVISRAAFGSSYLEGRRIFQLQGEQAKLTVLVMNKIYFPGYLFLPTRANRRRKQIAAEVDGILKGLIAKREVDLRTGQGTSDDLLGLLLESSMAHCTGQGSGLTTDEVIGECKRCRRRPHHRASDPATRSQFLVAAAARRRQSRYPWQAEAAAVRRLTAGGRRSEAPSRGREESAAASAVETEVRGVSA